MGLNITVTTEVIGDYTGTRGEAAQDAHVNERIDLTFLTGSGLDQASLLYTESLNIAASGSETLDLTALTDALDNALAFAAVKAIVILPDKGNTNNIIVGNAASNQFLGPMDDATATLTAYPGGPLVLTNPSAGGWAVNSGAKSLKLANSGSGTAVTGDLFIIGI